MGGDDLNTQTHQSVHKMQHAKLDATRPHAYPLGLSELALGRHVDYTCPAFNVSTFLPGPLPSLPLPSLPFHLSSDLVLSTDSGIISLISALLTTEFFANEGSYLLIFHQVASHTDLLGFFFRLDCRRRFSLLG